METKRKGDELVHRTCPKCGNNNWKFYVNTLTGNYICFVCDYKGRLAGGSYACVGVEDDAEAVALRKLFGAKSNAEQLTKTPKLPPLGVLSPEARIYLGGQRGLTDDLIFKHRLAEGKEWCAGRIVLPYARHSEACYWTARTYLRQSPKYIYPSGCVRPLYRLSYRPANCVFVVEGVFDAISIGALDGSALAIGGRTITTQQLAELFDLHADCYCILFDGDAVAYAYKALAALSQLGLKARVVVHPLIAEHGDISSLFASDPNAARELIKELLVP